MRDMPTSKPTPPPEYVSAAVKVRLVPIEELTTLPGNPRRGDIERIKISLQRFGQRYPSVVRGSMLLAGNNRLQAMKELGWTHVAVVDADDLTEEEAVAFSLADNRTSDLAEYDDEALVSLLDQLPDELLDFTGYDESFLADLASIVAPPQQFEVEQSDIEHETGARTREKGEGMTIDEVRQAWAESATRMMILTYGVEEFTELEEKLAALRREWGFKTNAAVVQRLIIDATAEEE